MSDFHKWKMGSSIQVKRGVSVCEHKVLRSRTSPDHNQWRTTPVKAWESIMRNTKTELAKSEECHASVGGGGIILVGNAAIVAKDLAFFSLDQSQQTIDG